jgi:hypothetical protein
MFFAIWRLVGWEFEIEINSGQSTFIDKALAAASRFRIVVDERELTCRVPDIVKNGKFVATGAAVLIIEEELPGRSVKSH